MGPARKPCDAPEPLHPTVHVAGNLSLIFFLCFWVEMNVTMQAGQFGEVFWDVSLALKRDDGVLLHEALEVRLLNPITPLRPFRKAASAMWKHPLNRDIIFDFSFTFGLLDLKLH